MSVTMERPQAAWQTHPGWGIAVDLTPREVVAARQVRIHQRLIALALLLVLGLCAAVSLLARADQASAERNYEREQARTVQLNADSAQYDDIVAMQAVIAQISSRLAGVMGPDVDVVNLMARLRTSLPDGLTVSSESVVLAPPTAATATDPAADAATGTATDSTAPTAPQIVGSVAIAGVADRVQDVTPFVAKLNALRGVVDVVPLSVTKTEAGTSFTISLNFTDELYTHRYDLETAP